MLVQIIMFNNNYEKNIHIYIYIFDKRNPSIWNWQIIMLKNYNHNFFLYIEICQITEVKWVTLCFKVPFLQCNSFLSTE